MEILEQFGVEPILLLAQIVNFAILLFILKRFLYKPIMNVLAERKKKIEVSIKQTEEIQEKYEQANTRQEEILNKARREGAHLVEEAKEEAQAISKQIGKEANESAEKLIKKAKETVQLEKQKMLSEVKGELVDVIAIATEKVAAKELKETERERIVKEAIEEIEQ